MSAADRFFVDSNVFLYRMSAREPEKRPKAEAWTTLLWRNERGNLSWQVVHEFYSNAVSKFKMKPAAARFVANHLVQWNPVSPGARSLERAWMWCDKAHLNFWDALIVAAAEQCQCRWLLSEDLQHRQIFGDVTVLNPFREDPAEFGLV
jgi:predicted nucleic acid-binding protein